MARQKFSAVILTKNVEDQVRGVLESVKWADEIVIVDGFSTDKTVDICKEYGAKIVQHKFGGDFGEERNIGIDNASGDWILQLDADDVVTEGFKKDLMKILEGEDRYVAYKFRRKNFFMGHFMKYGGWYHYSLHLLKKGYARYKGRVHHDLIVDGKTGTLESDVEHHPFQNFTQFIDRQNRYTTLEGKELFDLHGKMPDKKIQYNIRIKPIKLFWKFYVKKQGFREGAYGLVFSVLFAWVHFLKWAKYWEFQRSAANSE